MVVGMVAEDVTEEEVADPKLRVVACLGGEERRWVL